MTYRTSVVIISEMTQLPSPNIEAMLDDDWVFMLDSSNVMSFQKIYKKEKNMKEIKASEIQENMLIVDQNGDQIAVSEVWTDQGLGLGIVVKGKRILDYADSHNRYLDGNLPVRQIVSALKMSEDFGNQQTPTKD